MTEAASTLATLSTAVRTITARVFGISPDRVVGSAALVTDLGASSLDVVELVMAVEDAFRIEISDDNAATVVTVDDLEKLIGRLQATGHLSIAA